MITDKQRQLDYEYEADYQTKSPYRTEQWVNILQSGIVEAADLALFKQAYSSYNHAANLLQLSFHAEENLSDTDVLNRLNHLGQTLADANGLEPEADYSGNNYWWYLFFWGKHLPEGILELKMQPELTEAIGSIYPELEQAYYAFFGDVERSLQTRYSQEDAVWMAASVLLYEKYYRNPGISSDDILLMQYEVQTRAQRIFGQDVETATITQVCNADERGHRFNYLRDLYKYFRVSFPGEFDGDRERPDPENLDYNSYVYSLFGYMPLTQIVDFIAHEYAHLVDDSYVELNQSNGFVRMANFLIRQCDTFFSGTDTSEQALDLRAAGEDSEQTFHLLAQTLLREYPNFSYARKASWLGEDSKTVSSFTDVLYIEDYAQTGACIALTTLTNQDALNIEISLNLPKTAEEETMLDIQEKCRMLPLMTAAPFQLTECAPEDFDLATSSPKIKSMVVFLYEDLITMTEENILTLISTPLEIFASYYTDICQNYYTARDASKEAEDPLLAALGDKLVYRKGAQVPDPALIYREGTVSPSTEYIENVLQGYGADPAVSQAPESENRPAVPAAQESPSEIPSPTRDEADSSESQPSKPASHPDRTDQSFNLYPKNTLIQGSVKTAKFHTALTTAVGIIAGKEPDMMTLEPVSDILDLFRQYEQEGRIMHVAYPDLDARGYGSWIEGYQNHSLRDGIFKAFANRCEEGRYVVLIEDADLNWMHLFGETAVLLRDNRREGASGETAVTLHESGQRFTLPSNLYIVATCDSVVCEDTILGAISQDFFVRRIQPDASVLRGLRIEGIMPERLMTVLNLRLSYFLGGNYQLGEGFFLGTSDKDPFISLARVFREQIIPILLSWLDGDMEKIRYVLGDNGKARSDTVFFRETPFRETLFKGELPDSFDREMHIYAINEAAFFNPRSYIEIYE